MAGKVDFVVVTDEPSILLIEAKFRKSRDFKDKVLGQIVFYLAHVLECPVDVSVQAIVRAASYRANRWLGFWNEAGRQATEPHRDEVEDWIRRARTMNGLHNVRSYRA